jgi:hypothetical protein
VNQRILQSHVRKRPPRLRPRNEEFKWLKASSGRVAMGLPSKANNVKSLDSEKAIWGKIRIKLKPKSKTLNCVKDLMASNGNSVNKLFNNLKGCQLKDIPNAVRDLKGLAFLDLAQNVLKTLHPGVLQRLDSLTALNLERNVIQKLHRHVFDGVNDTLSSLSLLNNC